MLFGSIMENQSHYYFNFNCTSPIIINNIYITVIIFMTSAQNSGFQIEKIGSLKDLQKKFTKARPESTRNLVSKLSEEKPSIFEIVNTSGYNLVTSFKTNLCEYYEYRLIYYFLLYLKYEVPQNEQNTILIQTLFDLIQQETIKTFSLPFGLILSKIPRKSEVMALMKQSLKTIENYKGKYPILYAFNSNTDYDVSFISALHHLACNQGSLLFLLQQLGCMRCSIEMNQIIINDYIMKINRKIGFVEFKIQQANFHANCNTLNSFEIAQDAQIPISLHFSKEIERKHPKNMLQSSSNNFQVIQQTMREIESFDQEEPFISNNSSSDKILKNLLDQMPESVSKSLVVHSQDSIRSKEPIQSHQATQNSYQRQNSPSQNHKQCSIRQNMLKNSSSFSPIKIEQNFAVNCKPPKKTSYVNQYCKTSHNQLLTKSIILEQHFNQQKNRLRYNRVINEIYFPNDLDYSTPRQCKPISKSNQKTSQILSHKKMKTASTEMKNSNHQLQQNEIFTPRIFKNHFIETRNYSSKIVENQSSNHNLKKIKNHILSQKQTNDFQQCRRKLLQQYLKRQKQRESAFKKQK